MAKASTSSGKTTTAPTADLYSRIGKTFDKKRMALVILLAGIVLSLINFNARISEAHDDSLYIEAAYKYVHEFPNYFYTANAPMYPMFLAVLTLLFGTNLIVFKLFSVLFFVLGAWLYYKALDNKVPPLLRYFVLTFLCASHLIIYYSSQTFSEAFYMLIQATFFYFFLEYNWGTKPLTGDLKTDYRKWLMLGFLMFVLTLAKNILVFGVAAILVFYLLNRDYRKALYAGVSFALFKGIYEILKSMIWGESAIQYKSQMGILLNVDAYDASKGQETFAGFIGRFTDNFGLYLGRRFYQLLGFMSEDAPQESYFLAFLVFALVVFGLYRAVKDKQQVIAFLIFFAGTIAFGTFFVLQAKWDQARFIMVHMPALLLGIFYGLYRALQKNNFNQLILIVVLTIVSGSMLISSTKRGLANIPVVSKNLKGDIYYGYTPDWANYLRLSAWCADSLPASSLVACRKAPMSFVYGKGKHFYPIYSVIARDTATNQSNPDSALAIFRRNKVTHVLIASIRLNPKMNTGDVINTIHFILGPIMQKYPEKLRLVRRFGTDEIAELYEIRY